MFFKNSDFVNGVYFIGIGGVSMSALATLLHHNNVKVRGSDASEGEYTRRLRAIGIPVTIGSDEEITEPTVVYTGAIKEEHPQYAAARRAGKRLLPRSAMLGHIAEEYPHVISVAGCHGKTTTSCMIAHIFHANNVPFTSHIGGEDDMLGNVHAGAGNFFITEACEFQRSFLTLHSEIALILNCDRDHTDCYANEEELLSAYREFAGQAQKTIVNSDDVYARTIPHALDFGLYSGKIRAEKIKSHGEKYSFVVTESGLPMVQVHLNDVGKVHVYNALAAYAAARLLGFSSQQIKCGLENFTGVKRRFERVGTLSGVPVICDYAHHPREIAASIATAERLCRGTVRLVFQPHTYTRTRDFLEDFVEVLKKCESPIIYATYSARERYNYEGSAVRLASMVRSARYVESPHGLLRRIHDQLSSDDVILVLGAGDIYEITKSILD